MRSRNFIMVLLLTTSIAPSLFAMRCGGKLVLEGDSEYNVLSKCGEPLYKKVNEETIPLYNSEGYQIGVTTDTFETWIYQKSSAEFQYELIFDEGVLKEINANRNP